MTETARQPSPGVAPSDRFHAPFYIRHNHRRLEHLASLGLDLEGKSVLEPGAGIGDHTLFYLDRGCTVVAVEPRRENCEAFRANIAGSKSPNAGHAALVEGDVWVVETLKETYDIVHCYGLLYHLDDPVRAIRALAAHTRGMMLLESCVTPGDDDAINLVQEPAGDATQAVSGKGCRPTRRWILRELRALFPFVYLPKTQPAHNEFPLDWSGLAPAGPWTLTRAVYIASRTPLTNAALATDLPTRQSLRLGPN